MYLVHAFVVVFQHLNEPIIHGAVVLLICLMSMKAFGQTAPNACSAGQVVVQELANTGIGCSAVAYSALTGQPTIPAAQVNSDWNSVSGVSQIMNEPTIPTILPRSFNNAPSRTIQTVAAAGNGWQLSTTRDANVSYSVLITVTASIASGASGYVVLEVCPTNSSTAANWLEVARASSSQIYTLAVAIQGVQGAGQPIEGIVPAGYYARLRSVNVTSTPTYSFVSGQEVLL